MTTRKLLLYATFATFTHIRCIDLPQFYRAPAFAGYPQKDQRDWSSFFTARYEWGDTRYGTNGHHRSTELLSTWGDVNVSRLAINLENLTSTSKPKTYQYLRATSGTIPAYNFTGNDGHIDIKGRFEVAEATFELTQNLIRGVFVRAYIPFKKLKISNIALINKTNSANANAAAFQSFLDNEFDTVLSENGYAKLSTPFNKHNIGDPSFFLGWQGYGCGIFGAHIQDLAGEIFAGASLPVGVQRGVRHVAELPTGYDGHAAFFFRSNAELHFFRWISAGINAGATVFLPRTDRRRMKTDLNQSGIIHLEHGNAELELGTLWQVGGFVKFDRPIGGLVLLAGYSFTGQEPGQLTVKDSTFLNTFITADTTSTNPTRTSKDTIVNSSLEMQNWYFHTLHFLFEYDTRAHFENRLAPRIFFSYNLPIDSRFTWRTDFIGGGFGFSVAWKV